MIGLSELHSTFPQDCFSWEASYLKKNTFPIVFNNLSGNFSSFWANLFQHGSRNCIGFQAFQSGLCQFVSDFTQNFIGWSVRTALYVSTGLFSWEVSTLKKNSFQTLFCIFDGDFSGFRQKFSSTVVRTALDSKFLIGIKPTFFRFTQNFISWFVRTALYVSSGLFSWEAFSLKKTLSQLYFNF